MSDPSVGGGGDSGNQNTESAVSSCPPRHGGLPCQHNSLLRQNDSQTLSSGYYSSDEVPTHSRQGRQLQRYAASGERLVAGCLPIKWTNPQSRDAASVRVLLISSSSNITLRGRVFPKGGWETDETVEVAASRETVEEAGVRGRLEEPMLGVYPFVSKKQERLAGRDKGRCLAHMFVMNVDEELEEWPESKERSRFWLSLEDASRQLRHDWMREALHTWVQRQGWDHVLENMRSAAANATVVELPASGIPGGNLPLAQRA